jgi:hypothetical protein
LKTQGSRFKAERAKSKVEIEKSRIVVTFLFLVTLAIPVFAIGQEIKKEGWPIPDLKGFIPYSIQVKQVDGVEKIVEKFYTPHGGHVARISGNGKIFAYAVDSDREPPIDYLLLDPDGLGKFTQKLRSEDSYKIPEWVSH